MTEVLVVAPLEDMYEKTLRIIKNQQYDNVDVVRGNLQEGLEQAISGIMRGACILVSRGGTYKLLRNTLSIPVIEIKTTAYDIIESMGPMALSKEPVGVVGYKNVVAGFDILRPLLVPELVKVELEGEEDIDHAIEKYKHSGITQFIGDANIIQVSNRLGCTGVVISSSEDSIISAIENARSVVASARTEKIRSQQTIIATNFVHEGIIAVDGDGVISIFNDAAKAIFKIPNEQNVVNCNFNNLIYNNKFPDILLRPEPQIGHVLTIGTSKVVVNHAPVLVDGHMAGAVATIQDVTEMQNVEQKVRRQLADKGFFAQYTFKNIIHDSEIMSHCIKTAREYARYDSPVLITGESGVGKEIFSQSIHNASPRKLGPFVPINCAAIPSSLIEAELFGYAEGSFTGAKTSGRAGIFELAHRGTVFLDEIGDLPLELQGRLLRVLQEKRIMRLGDDKMIPVDVRVLCATNRNLRNLMEQGSFRQDLFFRINVLTLHIPSLQEQGEASLLALADSFLRTYSQRYNKPILSITPEIRRQLTLRDYKGNIRELEGLMERCVILSSFKGLEIPEYPDQPASTKTPDEQEPVDLKTMENRYILHVYHATGGDIKKTCSLLKINRTTLWRRLGGKTLDKG